MAEFVGWQKRLYLVAESNWGSFPASPSYLYLPHAEYSVRTRPRSISAELYTGLRQRHHRRAVTAEVSGRLQGPLLAYQVDGKSIAESLLAWTLSPSDSIALASYSAELVEAEVANKRHHGLRVDRATLRGDSRSGSVQFTLDLQGKSETAIGSGIEFDPLSPHPREFLFRDVTLSLNGTELELSSFELRIANNLQPFYSNSSLPSHLAAGPREIDIAFRVVKSSSLFDSLRRSPAAGNAIMLTLKGSHGGTGPSGTQSTQIELSMPNVTFEDAQEIGSLREIQLQEPSFAVLKPAGSTSELQVAFTSVA